MYYARRLAFLLPLASLAIVSDASPNANKIRRFSCDGALGTSLVHVPALLQMRGGGWAGRRLVAKNTAVSKTRRHRPDDSKSLPSVTRKVLPWAGAAAIISLLFIEFAENINAYITSVKPEWMDVEAFKAKLLDVLKDINENGGRRGLFTYVLFLSLWAACGLTTIPVESSAGMAFGWRNGLILNAMGKMSGSLLAYGVGRIFLEEQFVSKLEDNEVFGLVDKAVAKKPYGTSVLVRFFPFPELVKNLGLSILPPVQLGVFLAATFTHTFPFTILWTWLGCDTVAHMRDDTLAPNRALAAVLVAVTAFGVFGAPALVAMFVRSMKLEHDKASGEKKK